MRGPIEWLEQWKLYLKVCGEHSSQHSPRKLCYFWCDLSDVVVAEGMQSIFPRIESRGVSEDDAFVRHVLHDLADLRMPQVKWQKQQLALGPGALHSLDHRTEVGTDIASVVRAFVVDDKVRSWLKHAWLASLTHPRFL